MNTQKMIEWCSIGAHELEGHPDSKIKLRICEKEEVSRITGNMMADEVIANNAAGKITRWILPAGPMKQYVYFAERVNSERISLKNVYVFHMDEFLEGYYGAGWSAWSEEAQALIAAYQKDMAGLNRAAITGHSRPLEGVTETDYENGARVLVNYTGQVVKVDGAVVPARGYVVLKGGQ